MNRREFAASLVAARFGPRARAAGRPRILLRSSWQTVNIGDIAHTPGMLALIEKHLPQAEVRLWPSSVNQGVEELLRRRFPKLAIVQGEAALRLAFAECDFLLHGSGPSLVARRDVTRWRQETGKPFGIGGITLSTFEPEIVEILNGASFAFFRDSVSLRLAKQSGSTCPLMEFGPDATFMLDLRDDVRARAFLAEYELAPRRFACFVPRLRWTPYWLDGRTYAAAERTRKEAENEEHREPDHSKLRAAIIAWVRETGHKALLCPEMTYQVDLLRPLLFDPLPDDVKRKVVVRPAYWLTDEAASTYALAAAVVSLEMHSPIIAVANGTPAIHLRTPTDTHKGQMWRDVGLGDWIFEIDEATGDQIASRLLDLYRNRRDAEAAVRRARDFTARRGQAMMAAVSEVLTA